MWIWCQEIINPEKALYFLFTFSKNNTPSSLSTKKDLHTKIEMPIAGIEPVTFRLQSGCSATKLNRLLM